MQQIKLSGGRRIALGLVLFVAVPVMIGCSGCGGSTAKVTGVVTYKGEPLPSGRINFVGKEGALASAEIQSDGSYTVEAPLGEYTVTIITEAETPAGVPGALKIDSPNKQLKDAPKDSSARPDVKDEREKQTQKLKDAPVPGGSGKKRVVQAPPKYRSTDSSPLRFTVKPRQNVNDIELKD